MDMTDLGLEILRSLLLLGIVLYLYKIGKDRFQFVQAGWSAILAGFSLLLLGSVLDITNEFASLSRFVIMGNTDTQGFLEKLVGFSGGFLFLLIGLIWWIPTVQRLSEEIRERQRAVDELEVRGAERRLAEKALQESEERFRQLAETIPEVFYITNPMNDQMLYVSPRYEEVWGRSCESLYRQPQSWAESVVPEDHTPVLAAMEQHHKTSGYVDVEYRIVQPNGAIRWIHARSFPLRDATGTVYRVAGIAEDITERKQAEEQQRQLLAQI